MDRTILIIHRRVLRSTAGPKRSDLEIGDANNAGSYIVMAESDKLPRWRVGYGLCAVCVGFRLHYRYRYGLSKCSCFGSVTTIVVIVIVYRLFWGVIVPKLFEFRYQH